LESGLPDFSWYIIPKQEKMYQMNAKCTKWSQNIPKVRKILQMDIKYINILQSMYGTPKFTQIGIFGLKINHLATLLGMEIVG
jgi:hypothetical protein